MKAVTATKTKCSRRERLLGPAHEQGYAGRRGAEPRSRQAEQRATVWHLVQVLRGQGVHMTECVAEKREQSPVKRVLIVSIFLELEIS